MIVEGESNASRNDACVLYIGASPQLLPYYRRMLRDEFAVLCPGMACLVYAANTVRQASKVIQNLPLLGIVCFCNEGRREGEDAAPDARLLARLLNEHAGKPWIVLGPDSIGLKYIFDRASVEVRTYLAWLVLRDRYKRVV